MEHVHQADDMKVFLNVQTVRVMFRTYKKEYDVSAGLAQVA